MKKSFVNSLVAVSVIGFGLAAPKTARSSEKERTCDSPLTCWEQGSAHLVEGKFERAVEDYGKAIRLNKGEITKENIGNIHQSRGLAYFRMNEFRKAIDEYEEALRFNPDKPEVYSGLGLAYFKSGNEEAALSNYGKAIALNPTRTSFYRDRAMVYSKMRDFNHASADFGKAISLEPSNERNYLSRGIAYKNQNAYANSLVDFEKVLELRPGFFLAHYHMAAVYALMNRPAEACASLALALKEDSGEWPEMKAKIRKGEEFDSVRKSGCFREILKQL